MSSSVRIEQTLLNLSLQEEYSARFKDNKIDDRTMDSLVSKEEAPCPFILSCFRELVPLIGPRMQIIWEFIKVSSALEQQPSIIHDDANILLLSSTRNSVSITPAPESSQIVNKPFLTESIATQEEMEIETPSSASGMVMLAAEGKLNLLDHSLRAIGHLQVLDATQPRLLGGIETTFGHINMMHELQTLAYPEITPPGGTLVRTEQRIVLNRTPTTFIRYYEFFGCDSPASGNPSVCNVDAIQNWRTFSDTEITPERLFLRGHMQKEVKGINLLKKEEWYWALKMGSKSRYVTPGILDSAKKMNCTEWILPNGLTLGVDKVKAIALEVIPNRRYTFERLQFSQTGGIITMAGEQLSPYAMLIPNVSKDFQFVKTYFRRILPEGVTQTHYVIEATLPDGGLYIVDPTSNQFNYRRPGSLIVHGSWDDYVREFPGKVLQKLEEPICSTAVVLNVQGIAIERVHMTTAIDEMYYMGNGPKKLIDKMTDNITKYKDRRFCAYCGWIEGEHDIRPKYNCRYNFQLVTLFTCAKCEGVAYCGKMCQKAHWKEHKITCRAANG